MVMSAGAVTELVNERLWGAFAKEKERLDKIDRWLRWDADLVQLPNAATAEHRYLAELSRTSWLGLGVGKLAQVLHADGYRSPDNPNNSDGWRTWQANRMSKRQHPLHRAAMAYGLSYTSVLPGEAATGGDTAVIRGYSPRKMIAVYREPADDEWPLYALHVDPQPDRTWTVRLFDEEAVYFLGRTADGELEYIEYRRHNAQVCPVIRYGEVDLDGRADGLVEPYIDIAQRVNKTTYDRMLAQHHNSWKVRTAAGLTRPSNPAQEAQAELRLRQQDILVAEDPDTKFGTLDETPLEGLLSAEQQDIEALAAVTQTPTHEMTGQLVNLSAEALAAARASLTQHGAMWQDTLGESHAQTLRLAAYIEGNKTAAADMQSDITWQDMEVRSLAQAADALGKIAQMLGVPPQALWSRIPGITKSDVDEWKELASNPDELLSLLTAPPGTELAVPSPAAAGVVPSAPPNGTAPAV